MKIDFYCESPADRAAMEVFAEAILGAPPERTSMDLEARSMTAFMLTLRGVFLGVHFHSEAEALVIVGDCDDTEMHTLEHHQGGNRAANCRLCEAHGIIARAKKGLKPRQGRPDLKVAIGMPFPTIESWLLVGERHEMTEAQWKLARAEGRVLFTRPQLKELLYGTTDPPLERETERAVAAAKRIAKDLRAIETAFPASFGLMAEQIRSWRSPPPSAAQP